MNKDEFKKRLKYGDRYCVEHDIVNPVLEYTENVFTSEKIANHKLYKKGEACICHVKKV